MFTVLNMRTGEEMQVRSPTARAAVSWAHYADTAEWRAPTIRHFREDNFTLYFVGNWGISNMMGA